MTIEAQRPTGTPGTAPRGPAGPAPEPRGPRPSSPHPGTQKPPPSSPPPSHRLAAELDTAALLLRTIGVLRLPGMDPAQRMRLDHGLRIAQRAVEAAQTSQMVLGERPTPGLGTASSGAVTRSDGAVVAPVAGAISGREGRTAPRGAGSRPVQAARVVAGECLRQAPEPLLAGAVTESAAAASPGSAGALLPAGHPPVPGGDFLLPRDVRIGVSR